MATTITLKGKPITIVGSLPKVGSQAPDFTLTTLDLNDVTHKDYAGKSLILNIFPSIDTGTCANSVRQFNQAASKLTNTVVLCISIDLPFAQKRLCGAENLSNIVPLSAFRHPEFGANYGVTITSGPLTGFLSRAVVVIDAKGNIIYTQQVPEITEEPNYQTALQALSKPVTT